MVEDEDGLPARPSNPADAPPPHCIGASSRIGVALHLAPCRRSSALALRGRTSAESNARSLRSSCDASWPARVSRSPASCSADRNTRLESRVVVRSTRRVAENDRFCIAPTCSTTRADKFPNVGNAGTCALLKSCRGAEASSTCQASLPRRYLLEATMLKKLMISAAVSALMVSGAMAQASPPASPTCESGRGAAQRREVPFVAEYRSVGVFEVQRHRRPRSGQRAGRRRH